MHVSHSHRFLYLATPKTASTTVSTFLTDNYGAVRYGHYHGRELPPDTSHADYLRIATVRDPYSRAVSLWAHILRNRANVHHKLLGRKAFCEFAAWLAGRQEAFPCQAEFLREFQPQHLIRRESLLDDLFSLPFVVSNPPKLHEFNVGCYVGDWRDYYTPAIGELVKTWAAEDFAAFGYDDSYPG